MGYILKFPDAGAVVEALAGHVVSDVRKTLGRQAFYRWALAGGSTPGLLYRRLVQPDVAGSIDWRRIHLFWSDERCVQSGDPQSNYRMAKEFFLDHVPIAADNIFPIDGTLNPERSATTYAATLGDEPLDLVLLGMGDDGHTASLFPDTPSLREECRTVIATLSPRPPIHRISLSLRTINAARRVMFLVLGNHKAVRIAQVMDQQGRPDAILPAAMVNPGRGALHWFLDYAAAAELKIITSSSP